MRQRNFRQKEGIEMNPDDFNEFYDRVAHIYNELELELFEQMIKRLLTGDDFSKDHVLQWQTERLLEIGKLNQEAIKIIAAFTMRSEEEVTAILEEAVNGTIAQVDDELQDIATPPPFGLAGETVKGLADQTFLELDNLVNQTLITTAIGIGEVANTYRKIVEETTAKVLTGNKTINAVVAETVIKWRDKGLKSGFVDKGGKRWNMQTYAATVVKNTVNRTYNELRTQRMEDYGVDLVVVDTFSDARPSCARAQGRVLTTKRSKKGYKSIYDYGYGNPNGLRGINCRHSLTPFVKGLNKNNQVRPPVRKTDEQYKLSQKQRYLERQVRQAKDNLRIAKLTGDQEQIDKWNKKVRTRQMIVREFVKEHDLIRHYENEKVI